MFPFSDEPSSGDPPAVIIGLSVAIGLLTFMLIAGIIGFIILKSRVVNRRQRLSENQELTLQGPMIEVVSVFNTIKIIYHDLYFILRKTMDISMKTT